VTEEEVLDLFRTCSNVGRWGRDDQLGTLNLITRGKRLAALASVVEGNIVALGAPLAIGTSRQTPVSATLQIRDDVTSASDTLAMSIHGYEATHLDALGHVFFERRAWGGRTAEALIGSTGLTSLSVEAAAMAGIVTRGVLLDVAGTRGVEHLGEHDGISAADLDAAEQRAGARVQEGDAVFVRSGHAVRAAAEGDAHDENAPHEGVLPDTLPWLKRRDVAIYSSDCVEQRPSGYDRVPMPLHQVGVTAMGMWILDCPDLERLKAACQQHGRSTFALVVAPLRIPGGTGSAVNPLAIF
jgi:kynurenine formamidase